VVAQQAPSPEAWAAIVRLGRGLRNLQAWVLGLEELNKHSGLPPNQVNELVDAYEQLGQPEKAIVQLQTELQKEPRKEVLEHLGLVYERMGKVQEAITTFETLHEQFGSTLQLAKKRARLLYQRGNMREALTVLVEKQDEAPLDDIHYWETLGDVAWDLQNDAVSQHAYEKLFQHKELSAFELERYVLLVKEDDPQRAKQLAQQGWNRFSNVGFFLFTLDILQEEKEWEAVGKMLEGVTPPQLRLLESYQQYWLIRAEVFSRRGNVGEAIQSYHEALRRDPNSPSIRLAMLWLFIDYQQRDQLESWLVKWEKSAATDPRFWSGFATAYMLLELPVKALPYFERKFQKTPHDYLWVLYYADALEAADHRSRARNLRQYAWLTLRKEVGSGMDQAWNRDVMLAYARLALTRETGDGLSSIFTRLLHHKPDAAAQELILSWYLSREEYGPARFWLWRYYGRQLSKPNFAAIALALAENDWVAIDRLLTAKTPSLDRLQQVVAAKHLRRDRLVQTLAFEGVEDSLTPELYAYYLSDSILSLASSPLDTFQRRPLTGQLWSGVPNVDTRFRFQDRDPLRSQQVEHLWTVPLGRGLEFHPFASRRWQQTTDSEVFRRVPKTDTRIGGHLQWDMGSALGQFSLYHRKALSSLMALRARSQVTWDRRNTTEFLVGRNLEADTSVGMLVGGAKDLLRMSHVYQVSKWDSAFIQFDYPRFYSQDRKFIGQGFAVEGAWSHHLRLAYPDFSIRLSGNLQDYSPRQTVSGKLPTLFQSGGSTIPASNVLPDDFHQIELGAGIGESVFFSYGKTIRPFAFGGVNVNPETGVGANISGGLNGSIFGPDRLSLFGRYLRGGFGQDSTVTEWVLHYQLWF
jgi:tetratricopeptide (TPR) repeat protein